MKKYFFEENFYKFYEKKLFFDEKIENFDEKKLFCSQKHSRVEIFTKKNKIFLKKVTTKLRTSNVLTLWVTVLVEKIVCNRRIFNRVGDFF